jgi:LAGLIDADG DNA endonuclease family protein
MSLAASLPPASVTARCASGYMLENPVYPALPRSVRKGVYHGDNVTGAENQQERLIEFRGWVIGFVDGEGCFSIGLVRQPDRPGRRGYTTGYQVSHDFVVVQGANSARCLHELREFFGVGKVYVNRRHDNHRDDMHLYSVHRRQDLIDRIIPFFRAHPLRSAKQLDFEKFASCVELMAVGHHLTREGLADVVEIMQTMNRRKPRHELIRILRGHTPDVQDIGR